MDMYQRFELDWLSGLPRSASLDQAQVLEGEISDTEDTEDRQPVRVRSEITLSETRRGETEDELSEVPGPTGMVEEDR